MLVNIIFIYLSIFNPILELKKEILERDKLRTEIINLNRMYISKENQLKDLNNSLLNGEDIEEEKQKFIFESEFQVFQFIDKISKENDINIELLGREMKKSNILEEQENSFYLSIRGKEKDIYNFLFQIEKTPKQISIKDEPILILINGDILELEVNIVYINNNKQEFLEFDYYKNGIFKKVKFREIGKKRRVI